MKTGEKILLKNLYVINLNLVLYPSSDPAGPLGHHQHHGGPHPPDQDGQDDQDEQVGQDGAPGHPRPEGHGRLRHRALVSQWLLRPGD